MKNEEKKSILNRINQEGFHYCFESYSRFEEIKDDKFHRLRLTYLKSVKDMQDYLKSDQFEEEESIIKTTISGASDDLIELGGAISEEYGCYGNKGIKIECSDGTKAKIFYDKNGEWKINNIKEGFLFDKLVKSTGENNKHMDEDTKNCCSYSDVLVIKEGIIWIKIDKKRFKI
jgi:hypothetical protein